MKLIAKVNSIQITEDKLEKYGKFIVARYEGIELWYYGTYKTRKRAEEVAWEIGNGIVLEAEVEKKKQRVPLLKKGDTIKCSDKDEAAEIGDELCNLGINWDFCYELNGEKGIWIMILSDEVTCEDCISRKAVIDVLTKHRVHFVDMVAITSDLKNLPSVKPKTDVLDKIRAEIEHKAHSGQWSDATMYGLLKAVAIIDKYKAESEDKE